MQKKTNIYMYDPQIYPRKLWVATSLEGLDGRFTFTKTDDTSLENEGEYESLKKTTNDNATHITVGPVIEKDSGLLGVIAVLHDDPSSIRVKTFAHEGVHVADYFCQELGIYTQEFCHTNEAYAYLVGWAAGCIEDAINK